MKDILKQELTEAINKSREVTDIKPIDFELEIMESVGWAHIYRILVQADAYTNAIADFIEAYLSSYNELKFYGSYNGVSKVKRPLNDVVELKIWYRQ